MTTKRISAGYLNNLTNDIFIYYMTHSIIKQLYNNFIDNVLSNKVIAEAVEYHQTNDISLYDNVFRMYSKNYYGLYNYTRRLFNEGKLTNLNYEELELLKTDIGKFGLYEGKKVPLDVPIFEAEYQGKDVELNKPKRGGSKKFYVYVKDGDKVKKVSFGASGGGGKLAVKLKDPEARRAFADRHNCEQKNDKTKPGYWACRLPRYAKSLGLSGGGTWW